MLLYYIILYYIILYYIILYYIILYYIILYYIILYYIRKLPRTPMMMYTCFLFGVTGSVFLCINSVSIKNHIAILIRWWLFPSVIKYFFVFYLLSLCNFKINHTPTMKGI